MNINIHIIVFTGRHPVLSFFVEQLTKYLTNKSIDFYLVDADNPSTYNSEEFDRYAMQPNTCVFMFNNIGIGLISSDGESFWKAHNIPVFDLLVDHPRNFGDTLREPVCDIYAFALDLDHVSFMKQHYPLLKGIFFSPNGGTEIDHTKPFSDREIDVLYMGNCNSMPTSFPNINIDVIDSSDYYQTTISLMLTNPKLSTDEAIDYYLSDRNIDLKEYDKYYLVCLTSGYIENVIRNKTKLEGMKALDESGIHVEVFGGSWITEDCPFSENIVIHDRIDIKDLLSKTCDAKISLCFLPWFKKGCSEKNFDTMLNGALCVTDSSEYLTINYRDGYNIVFFDLNNPAQMAADIKWLLANPADAEVIAKRGYETCLKYDTWNNRFDFVLEKMYSALTD